MQAYFAAAGGLLTALAGAMASWALVLARRNERRSANKDETQQAFDLQQVAMGNIVADNERLRARQGELHDTVNRVVGKLGEMTTQHARCEEQLDAVIGRLRVAEARIHELGG